MRLPQIVPALVRSSAIPFGRRPAAPAEQEPPRIAAASCRVAGRKAVYGLVEGDGDTVVFLHGWGLSYRCYTPALESLALSGGHRVVAPDLPGFGGSSDLPFDQLSLAAYAEWVSELIDVLGAAGPVHLVGHSFGGGVCVRLAHDAPRAGRSVVLVDSLSGSTWQRAGGQERSLAGRPLWDWAFHLAREVPLAANPLPAAQLFAQVAENMFRHPFSFGLAAHVAFSADLLVELAAVEAGGTPVTVIWAEHDEVIPRAAFEDQCAAVGHAGEIVQGNHSWPMASPQRFAEVVSAAIGRAGHSPS